MNKHRKQTHFRSNGDAALALEANGIESALVGEVGAALPQQLVHQSRLPVINMGNHGHVPEPGRVETARPARRGRGRRGSCGGAREAAATGEASGPAQGGASRGRESRAARRVDGSEQGADHVAPLEVTVVGSGGEGRGRAGR